jgi:hypothetical protein
MKAAKRKASRRGAKRVRTQPVLDCVSRVLIENGVPLTQRNADTPEGFEEWPEDELPVN